MALLRSTPAGDPPHRHAILTLPDGSAVAHTHEDGHSHKLIPVGNAPQMPPMGGQGGPPPALPMAWTVGPDGHTHEGVEDPQESPITDEKPPGFDTEIVSDVIRLFKTAREVEFKARKMAVESEEFYSGEGQWDERDKKALEAASRAALTLNEIEPKIDLLSGYQRQNRSDIKYLPVEDGDQRVVDVLNTLTSNILDQCNYEYEETNIFDDGLIAGRGFFHVFVDYDKNPQGEIVVEQFPWSDAYLGPHKRADCKDLEYYCKAQWFSEAKLKQMYPEKVEELSRDMASLLGLKTEPLELQPRPDGYDHAFESGEGRPAPLTPDGEMVDIARKEFLLVECWRKEYRNEKVAVIDEKVQSLPDWSEGEINGAKQFAKIVERKVDRIRVTLVAGTVLLSDEYSDLYGGMFPLIPYYAKKRGDRWWGKVEAAKDAQREINKRHSQIVDILNKAAAYGWFYDGNTFTDIGQEQKFKDHAGTPGFTLKVSDTARIPVQIEGIKFPNEIQAMEEVSTTKLREIMNINPELLGINTKAESGLAQIEKKRQGLIGNEYLFDNLNLCKKQLGRLLIQMIRKVYTPQRVLRVLGGQLSQDPNMKIGQQPYTPDRNAEIVALLTTQDLEKYDVAVSESAHSPTQRRANFAAWADLAGKGIPVPPQLLVQLSDLDGKEEVINQINQMMQAQAEAEQKKLDAEIQKTLIAKGAQGPQAPPSGPPQGPPPESVAPQPPPQRMQ